MKHALNPNRRPRAGKAGTDGCYMVEVVIAATGARSSARRFLTEAEGRDFFTRSSVATQSRANREQRRYVVAFFRTASSRSTDVVEEFGSTSIEPL